MINPISTVFQYPLWLTITRKFQSNLGKAVSPPLTAYTHPLIDPTYHINDSSISSCIFTELCNKVLTGYNGYPTHHPKWYPDPISHFARVHPSDRQSERLTDRWARRQACTNICFCFTDYIMMQLIIIIITRTIFMVLSS